jgi:hypothetical protein
MEFSWQQSRGEALYYDVETKRIAGFISWENENRLKIAAHGINTKAAKEFAPLGMFTDEMAAKKAVEENAAKVFPPPAELVDANAKSVAAGLTESLEKGLVKK